MGSAPATTVMSSNLLCVYVFMCTFLPRDAIHSADYAVERCPSVCLSYAGVLSKRVKLIIKLFLPSDSHTILFNIPNVMTIFRRGPPNGGVECRGGRKIRDFRPVSSYLPTWALT